MRAIAIGLVLWLASGACAPAHAKRVLVPYINQHAPEGWKNLAVKKPYFPMQACGQTCMAMTARAFGYRPELSAYQLILHLNGLASTKHGTPLGGGTMGTDHEDLLVMAKRMRLRAIPHQLPSASWIDAQLHAGRLVVASVLVPKVDGPHYVLIAGKTRDGRYKIFDPFVGRRTALPSTLARWVERLQDPARDPSKDELHHSLIAFGP